MRKIAAIAVLTIAAPVAAEAAGSFYATYIAERKGAAPCYARTYDAKHLAANPKQKVIHFFVTHSDVEDMTPPKTFEVGFGFRIRGSSDFFSSEAGCAAKRDGAICSAEGDGGEFRLTPREDGLLVTIVDRLELEGMESFSPNLADSDDRELRLYESAASECHYDTFGEGEEEGEGGAAIDPLAPQLPRPDYSEPASG